MVVLTVGSGQAFEQLPAMRDVTLRLKDAPFHPKDERYEDRVQFIYEIVDVEDEEHEEHIGKEHFVYATMPGGKTGELHPRSNMYQILEGMSGGEFNPKDEIDTDDYVGKLYVGDFKREPAQRLEGTKFVTYNNDDGTPAKTTKLRNLRPKRTSRKRPAAEPVQTEHDWDDDEDA
jgi:hypothetical protein